MRILLALLFVGAACADTGTFYLACPDNNWVLYRHHYEATCMRLMTDQQLFKQAYEECAKERSQLLSFAHRHHKIHFVNDLILKQNASDNVTLWFFDPTFMSRDLHKIPEQDLKDMPKTVIVPNKDPAKVHFKIEREEKPHNFICEAPAQPVTQRPKFSRQPEDLQISEDLIEKMKTQQEDERRPKRPFIATFNCHAFAKPKPTLEWATVFEDETNDTLVIKKIEAKQVFRRPTQADHKNMKQPIFFDLRRDCRNRRCPADHLQERSQLVVINAHLLNPEQRIVCIAENEMGAVLSREAQIIIANMTHFKEEVETVEVEEGKNVTISCELETNPDSASVEWLRIERPDEMPIPLEILNQRSRGSIQMSKSTFDLILDFAIPQDSGMYLCRVRMHSGRVGHVVRQRRVELKVKKCKDCAKDKELTVVEGYPVVLSMNPLSNEYIRTTDDYLLECPCIGKRRPEEVLRVEWNMTVEAEEMPILPRGYAMLVRNASESHNGEVLCRCIREKEESEWAAVEVNVLPMTVPENHMDIVDVKVGKKALITCHLEQLKKAQLRVTVTPMHGARNVDRKDKRFDLSLNKGVYTIAIKNVSMADQGAYGFRVDVDYFGKVSETDTYYTTLKVTE